MKTRHWAAGFWRIPRFVPRSLSRSALLGLASLCLAAAHAPAQTYSVLFSFGGANGANPEASLALSGTTLYGTARTGGTADHGTVFKINTNGGDYTVIKRFTVGDGASPRAELALSGTTLYGTTQAGNNGTLFKVNTDGSGFTVLKQFYGTVTAWPYAGLLVSDTTLWGTTSGGSQTDLGTVFRLRTDGSGFTVLKRFTGDDGRNPYAGLLLSGSALYGTTSAGGASGWGTVFKVNTDGSGFTVLKSFDGGSEGANPRAGLILSGTALYGTAQYGGNGPGYGAVFKVNTDGSGFTVLKRFNGSDGGNPYAGLVLSGLTLYGTTVYGGTAWVGSYSGYGTVFQVNTDGSGFTVLKQFTGSDGANPYAGLVLSGLTLYGTASNGGSTNCGVVFRLVLPQTPTILTPPTDQTAALGSSASFSVGALGAAPLAYQWFFNGTNAIAGATDAALQLINVQPDQAGAYAVVVTNAFGAVTSPPALLSVVPVIRTVTNCTEAALRAALAGGGTVRFACDGTITLTSTITNATDTILDGNGHHVTISGSNAVRVFFVNTNVTFAVANLTVADGLGRVGAGLCNAGGTVALTGVVFQTNTASAESEPQRTDFPQGGAIFNLGGTVNATNCAFLGNLALQTSNCCASVAQSQGGALCNAGGLVHLEACWFAGNAAWGAPGPFNMAAIHDACGGAIANSDRLNINACTFLQNSAVGTLGGGAAGNIGAGQGGSGSGGAICNFGVVAIDASAFVSNTVTGGHGGPGADGAGGFNWAAPGLPGGAGGSGNGGALFNAGVVRMLNCTLAWNAGTGGAGGSGGAGGDCHPSDEPSFGGDGGAGGPGGLGVGGLFDTNGLCYLTNCTIALNSGIAGFGGTGGHGGYGTSPGQAGAAGADGPAAGGLRSFGATLVNTLLAVNAIGEDCLGTLTDAGHNLSSDTSCAFTNAGSLNNTDPKLGPLADNGGPTLTMALLPGSPAIDGGDTTAAPATDQRGGFRPAGMAADIGAYEYGSLPTLHITAPTAGAVDILLREIVVPSCRLVTSTNFANWLPLATNQVGADGTALFHVPVGPGDAQRLYRVALP